MAWQILAFEPSIHQQLELKLQQWFSTHCVWWSVRQSTGKQTGNHQDWFNQSEVRGRFVGPSHQEWSMPTENWCQRRWSANDRHLFSINTFSQRPRWQRTLKWWISQSHADGQICQVWRQGAVRTPAATTVCLQSSHMLTLKYNYTAR